MSGVCQPYIDGLVTACTKMFLQMKDVQKPLEKQISGNL